MILPNRIVVFTKKFTLFFLIGLSPTVIGDELDYKEKLKLKEIQSRVINVNKKIEKAKERVRKSRIELKNNELMANKISIQLENIQDRILKKKNNLRELEFEKGEHQQILNKERGTLISQVKTIYKIGKYNYLKLLLNQQNSSQITRAIAYYDYDNYARSKRIKKLKHALENIEKIKLTVSKQTSKLESLEDSYKFKLNKFKKYRGDRLKFIKDIDKYIKQQGIELVLLKENERELGKLLNRLKTHQIYKNDPIKKELGFNSKKGELIWPISGKLLRKYGEQKKTTGLKWEGVLIEAGEGSQVSAVSEGKIVFADWFRNFGLLMIIEHENDFLSLYGHNQKLLKSTGDFVQTGEKIATVGDSGGIKNSALYFEIRKGKKTLDPSLWCKK